MARETNEDRAPSGRRYWTDPDKDFNEFVEDATRAVADAVIKDGFKGIERIMFGVIDNAIRQGQAKALRLSAKELEERK